MLVNGVQDDYLFQVQIQHYIKDSNGVVQKLHVDKSFKSDNVITGYLVKAYVTVQGHTTTLQRDKLSPSVLYRCDEWMRYTLDYQSWFSSRSLPIIGCWFLLFGAIPCLLTSRRDRQREPAWMQPQPPADPCE